MNTIIGFFNALIRAWNNLDFEIPGIKVPGPLPDIPGFTVGTPDIGTIPRLASGARNFQGGLAMVGERGPELVNLPRGSDVTPSGGPGTIVVHAQSLVTMQGSVLATDLEDIIDDFLRSLHRRCGLEFA